MKILYSLPHPSHRLDTEGAGHTVRANAILSALETLGAEVIRHQAAQDGSQAAAQTYRQLVKKFIPRPIAMNMRDRARVAFGKQYGERLTNAVRQQQPDVILQTHIAFSLSGQIASEATGVPLVLDDVAPSWEEEQQYGVGSQKLAKETHRAVMEQASLCVAVSGPMRRFLEEDGVAPEKLITVANGIDERTFNANADGSAVRQQYGFDEDTIVIVFVGSFQPYHRVDLLLEAFSRVNAPQKARLLLVGDGRTRHDAEGLTRKLNIEQFTTLTGRVDYTQVAQHAAAGDIAVIPAHASYANPMKMYEYMSLGIPVIAPNQEAVVEIGTHEQSIYTFDPENIESMAAALTTLIDDKALRERLGKQAAQTIADEHTWTERGKTLLGAMECLL